MAEFGSSRGPDENIYTVLVFVAALALIAGIVCVMVRGSEVFGGATWFLS